MEPNTGRGAAHDATVVMVPADDVGALELALIAARAKYEADMPKRLVEGLRASRAKLLAQLATVEEALARAEKGII